MGVFACLFIDIATIIVTITKIQLTKPRIDNMKIVKNSSNGNIKPLTNQIENVTKANIDNTCATFNLFIISPDENLFLFYFLISLIMLCITPSDIESNA
jgi:hypothetical protein